MYCAWRIPAHLRCTQCSILLHLMDICFLTCICLWQISQIQTFLFKVIGPGLVSTSPAFVSSRYAWPACPKNGKSGPHCWGRGGSTQFALQLESAVTAPPLVGCVVCSAPSSIPMSSSVLCCKCIQCAVGFPRFTTVILTISLFPDSMVPFQKGGLNICSCMLHIDFFDWSVRPETCSVRHPLGMCFLDASHMS